MFERTLKNSGEDSITTAEKNYLEQLENILSHKIVINLVQDQLLNYKNNSKNLSVLSKTNENLDLSKKTMRVDETTIDSFLSFTGELISTSETFNYLQEKLAREALDSELKKEFKNAILAFQNLSMGLQSSIMEIRKIPLNNIFAKYPKLVRDISLNLKKKVNLELIGSELKVDKSLLEILDDPIVHILRNSLDHGLESTEQRTKAGKPSEGKIKVIASVDKSSLILTIKDDGKGIDPNKIKTVALQKGVISQANANTMSENELIQLIFAPGFSTAEQTTEVSGRGVGMDVVLTNIQKMNGTVNIHSVINQGTDIIFKIPLTVTTMIIKALIVKAENEQFIIPLDYVHAIEEWKSDVIYSVLEKKEMLKHRDSLLPIFHLTEALGWRSSEIHKKENMSCMLIVIGIEKNKIALVVDELVGIQQVVTKDTGDFFSNTPHIKGGAVLRDGRVGLLINFEELLNPEKT